MSSPALTADQRELYEKVMAFWTPERIASARPRDAWPGPVRPRPAPAAPSFETEKVADPSRNPYCRAGKLLMTFSNGEYAGSACAIEKNGILTAAHNLYDHKIKEYAETVLYLPGCREDSMPFGGWLVETPLEEKAQIPEDWIKDNQKLGLDYAFVRTLPGGKPDNQRPLGSATGFFTLTVDQPEAKDWTTLGYPDTPTKQHKFNGKEMWSSRGTKIDDNPWASEAIAKGGDLTHGASGGPWLMTSVYSLKVNGIQTFRDPEYPDVTFSPIFNKDVEALYKKAFGH